MSAAISPLALNRIRAQEALKADLAAVKADEECDREVAGIAEKAHKKILHTALDEFQPKPWRLEIAELRLENGKLKKDLEFSRAETESMIKRNLMIEAKMQKMQQTILFYGDLLDTYQAKLGPFIGINKADADKLYG